MQKHLPPSEPQWERIAAVPARNLCCYCRQRVSTHQLPPRISRHQKAWYDAPSAPLMQHVGWATAMEAAQIVSQQGRLHVRSLSRGLGWDAAQLTGAEHQKPWYCHAARYHRRSVGPNELAKALRRGGLSV